MNSIAGGSSGSNERVALNLPLQQDVLGLRFSAFNRVEGGYIDNPANGVTFCTGSLGADAANDLPAMIRSLGARGRIHFMHCRNVRRTGEKQFHESPHPTGFGSVNMFEVIRALRDVGYEGPMRPDHGRMIWGERGRPGYGLYDRALGAMYLQGLWEGAGMTRSGND